jgi:hypothetical protein
MRAMGCTSFWGQLSSQDSQQRCIWHLTLQSVQFQLVAANLGPHEISSANQQCLYLRFTRSPLTISAHH